MSSVTLNRGVIITNNYSVIVPSGANISSGRTPQTNQEAYINGNLIYRFNLNGNGSSNFNSRFEVGDTYYAPIDAALNYNYNFPSLTYVDLVGSSRAGIDPNDTYPTYPSGISPTNRANHYWTLGYANSSAGTFSTVSANTTFNFNGVNTDATGNTLNYVVAKNDANTWSMPAVGTITANSIQATGLTTFSNFEVGEACAVPVVSQTTTPVLCHGSSSGSATLTVTGGTPPLDFSWSNGATTQNISNATAGIYFVTVSSATGCGAIASATITQPALLLATCSGTKLTCTGYNDGTSSVITTGGTAPYFYLWNNGSTQTSIQNLSVSTYSVTITDSCGAVATCAYNVANPTALSVVTGGTGVTCFGAGNGTASITASGGTSPYSYLWSNGVSNAQTTNLQPKTYFVTVTDFCGTTIAGSFTVSNPPTLSTTGITTGVSCQGGSDGSATLSPTGGTSPYSYSWSIGSTSSSVNNLTAGNYIVSVTDFCGVSLTTSISITQPSILNISCVGTNGCHNANNGTAYGLAVGGTAPYLYLWSNGGTQQQITNLQPQTYSVTVTDAYGCNATNTCTVINPPALTVTAAASPTTICATSTINFSSSVTGGTPGYSYLWTGPSGYSSTVANPIYNPPSSAYSGNYTLTVSDANNCTAAATTTVTVTNCSTTLNLKLYIQGYYGGSGFMRSVMFKEGVAGATNAQTDTIRVLLRNASSPYAIVDSAKIILLQNGTATASLGFAVTGGDYYIVIKHRNTLETWSKNPVHFSTITSYDFTTSDNMAYGNNMMWIDFSPNRFALFNGDMNQDGNIDLIDFPNLDFGINNGLFGYYLSDLNGDGNTDLLDFPVLDTNINNGVFSKHP